MAESGVAIASTSMAAAASGYSICVVQDVSGFEILAYTTSTLVSGNIYALTGLYRGLYGTSPRFFGAGSRFMGVWQSANFVEQALPPAYIGQTLYVKAQSFNVFNSATQDLNEVVAYTYVPTSATPVGPTPPPPQGPMRSMTFRQKPAERGRVIKRPRHYRVPATLVRLWGIHSPGKVALRK
jgi:hypothetical protein